MKKQLKEWLPSVGIIIAVVAMRVLFVDVVKVDGMSMYPTMETKDRLVREKLSHYSHQYSRGDIVVLRDPAGEELLVKRIVGLAGETIESINGVVYIDGEQLKEEYLPQDTKTFNIARVKIPEDQVYVLGDNRGGSKDSRDIGPVELRQITGSIVYRFKYKSVKTWFKGRE
jgi:signal peptidase I